MRIDGQCPLRKAAPTSQVRRYACGQWIGFPPKSILRKASPQSQGQICRTGNPAVTRRRGRAGASCLDLFACCRSLRPAAMPRQAAAIHADVTGAHTSPRTRAWAPFHPRRWPVDGVPAGRTAELTRHIAHRRHHPSPVPFPHGLTHTKGFSKWLWDGARCILGAFHGSILTLSSWWLCWS